MASAIIHICVAKRVNEILNRNEKELFLGSIAPDISKQIGRTKEKSHFLDGKKDDVPNLDQFLIKYQNSLKDNAFNLGYYCHLYVDKCWYLDFINKFISYDCKEIIYLNGKIIKANSNAIRKILYNDYTNINISLIDGYDLDLSLFYDDAPTIISSIDEIPLDKLWIIIDQMGIIIENSKNRPTLIFDSNSIVEFIDQTANNFINNLKELGVI